MKLLTPEHKSEMPLMEQVRELYFAASAEPPLNETKEVADLFARLYEVSLTYEPITAVATYEEDMLIGFAYGYPWSWAAQQDEWADTLRERLGEAANQLEATYVLSLLVRHPRVVGTGTGRAVLQTWLEGIGAIPCWLQTSDLDSPARHLYESQGFFPIGHGPNAPNNEPGLILFRNARR